MCVHGGRLRVTMVAALCMVWSHLVSLVSESFSIRVSVVPMWVETFGEDEVAAVLLP